MPFEIAKDKKNKVGEGGMNFILIGCKPSGIIPNLLMKEILCLPVSSKPFLNNIPDVIGLQALHILSPAI